MLKIDFLKNLKKFMCFLRITPVEKSLTKLKFMSNNEKNNCLNDVEILKIFWKKYSEPSKKYFEFFEIKKSILIIIWVNKIL